MSKANTAAKAQVCLDLHNALGVEWGHDPYARISQLQTAESLLREMYTLILNHEVQLVSAGGGIWTWPDRANAVLTGGKP